jgi:hypothetical protein
MGDLGSFLNEADDDEVAWTKCQSVGSDNETRIILSMYPGWRARCGGESGSCEGGSDMSGKVDVWTYGGDTRRKKRQRRGQERNNMNAPIDFDYPQTTNMPDMGEKQPT